MAEIKRVLMFRHLRAEASSYVLHYRSGKLVRSGRGLAFWFLPLSTGVAEVPMDDRELPLMIAGRSSDYQSVTAQGVLTYRVVDPEILASRVDFGIDLREGRHLSEPLEKLGLSLGQLAAQLAQGAIAETSIRKILETGCVHLRDVIEAGMHADAGLGEMGVEIVSTRIGSVRPTADLERALEAPTRERIQQDADEAAFARRAMAVEKERAIQENELQNRIELAKKEEALITQQGANTRRTQTEKAEAAKIEAESAAANTGIRATSLAHQTRVTAEAQADANRLKEAVRVEAERLRMEIHKELPPQVLYALAARELAAKLTTIEHLSITPELLGPMISDLVRAGTKKLEA